MDNATSKLTGIEDIICYRFKNRELLGEAFTHKSYNSAVNNELLEFKGDKILNAIIGIHLSDNFELNEGILSKLTSYFVDNKSILPEVCLKHGLDGFISINDREMKDENSRENWVPSLLEALIGAIFIDSGNDWITTKKVVLGLYGDELILDDRRINRILGTYDPVSSLKEFCDSKLYSLHFHEEKVGGMDHEPEHVGCVWIDGKEFRGDVIRGRKKKARENVCEKVLSLLQENEQIIWS